MSMTSHPLAFGTIEHTERAGELTAPQRATHYMQWHLAAYGAPAPHDEVLAQLRARHGMTKRRAENLLNSMAGNGQITKQGEGWSAATGV